MLLCVCHDGGQVLLTQSPRDDETSSVDQKMTVLTRNRVPHLAGARFMPWVSQREALACCFAPYRSRCGHGLQSDWRSQPSRRAKLLHGLAFFNLVVAHIH